MKRVDKSKSWKRHNGTATTNMNDHSSIRFGAYQNDVEQLNYKYYVQYTYIRLCS